MKKKIFKFKKKKNGGYKEYEESSHSSCPLQFVSALFFKFFYQFEDNFHQF